MKTLNRLRTQDNKFFDESFYVFDTETTPFEIGKTCEFIFGVVYGYSYQKVIHSKQEFIKEFLHPRYTKKKVFAHNAEFDLNVLYDNIYVMDNEAIFNGKFICATNGNCMFADSLNIFPTSVKVLGDLSGKPKLELSKEFWNSSDVTENDITYCIRDCEIVFDALSKIFEMVGSIKITLAGLSMELFRRKYLKFNIDYDEEKCNYFFNSYYGGRTEAFYIGKCEAFVYDVNSMYPDAMKKARFPNPKYFKHKKNIPVEQFIEQIINNEKFEGLVYCSLHHKDNFFGFLPYRGNGKLLFPIGDFSAWYNFPEIRFALLHGVIEIKEVFEVIYSTYIESPFIDYVDELYRLRFAGANEFEAYLYKLFSNALYGKFAQKIISEQIYIEDIRKSYKLIEDYKTKKQLVKISMFNEMRNDCFIEISNNKASYTSTTIAMFSSYITSVARVHLLTLLLKYKEFKPLYCDTDSAFFEIDPQIPNSKLLGEFKKENKIITEICGLKNYSYISDGITRRKLKGVPQKAIFDEKANKYKFSNLIKTREGLRRNISSGTFIERTKELVSKYDKRNVFSDGNTSPLYLPESAIK
jgi:hypothetical protein